VAGLALATTGAPATILAAGNASAASTYHDSAYGISATGAAPIRATPVVSSTNGTVKTASGSARSSDGTVSTASASVRAGAAKATARVSGFSAFGGLVSGTVSVACDHGVVSGTVSGTPAGTVGRKGTVEYQVISHNANGSTTIIGMRVVTPAETINVGSATCAPASAPGPSPDPTGKKSATARPTHPPTSTPSRPAAPKPAPTEGALPVTG
jgi:hypothetical protein